MPRRVESQSRFVWNAKSSPQGEPAFASGYGEASSETPPVPEHWFENRKDQLYIADFLVRTFVWRQRLNRIIYKQNLRHLIVCAIILW